MRFIDDITRFIFLEDEPREADIIIIPGGSYAEIAEKAANLWKQGYAPYVLPSGKYSVKRGYFPGPLSKADIYNKQYRTEWDFLKDVLVSNGVDEEAVLREDQSTTTYENAACCRKVTDRLQLDIKTAIICCKSFHARRCLMYFQSFYPNAEFIVCPSDTQGIDKQGWFKSNYGIERVLGELARCGNQFVDIVKSLNK
jgi:uncharacterized SAM-binding protein YcdF (DUF218 family)